MFYQVRVNLFFTEADEAKDFYHDCQLALAKANVINPDRENIEFSIIERIDNNHDQDPALPCELVEAASNQPKH